MVGATLAVALVRVGATLAVALVRVLKVLLADTSTCLLY
jgi:hypothetical protein